MLGLAIAALGVVFGDMGTNPLFAMRETLEGRWREHLFAFMSRNTTGAATYFGLPPDQAVEVGLAVEL